MTDGAGLAPANSLILNANGGAGTLVIAANSSVTASASGLLELKQGTYVATAAPVTIHSDTAAYAINGAGATFNMTPTNQASYTAALDSLRVNAANIGADVVLNVPAGAVIEAASTTTPPTGTGNVLSLLTTITGNLTIKDANGASRGVNVYGIYVPSNNITLDGLKFNITDETHITTIGGVGSVIVSAAGRDKLTFTNLVIEASLDVSGAGGVGTFIGIGAGATNTNVTITNNTINLSGVIVDDAADDLNGITVNSYTGLVISGNTVTAQLGYDYEGLAVGTTIPIGGTFTGLAKGRAKVRSQYRLQYEDATAITTAAPAFGATGTHNLSTTLGVLTGINVAFAASNPTVVITDAGWTLYEKWTLQLTSPSNVTIASAAGYQFWNGSTAYEDIGGGYNQ
jgi:hypothetical protein